MKKPIVLASDHAGYPLKEALKRYLQTQGYDVKDVGTSSEQDVDYPNFAKKGVEMVLHYDSMGIFVCGSGIGISIAANRHKRIRAARVVNQVDVQLARQHNNANIICLAGRFLDEQEAERMVDIFLETPFIGGQHKNRIELLDR